MNLERCLSLAKSENRSLQMWRRLSREERAAYALIMPNSVMVEEGDNMNADAWWDRLSRQEQLQYVKEHPTSKYKNMLKRSTPKPKDNSPQIPGGPPKPDPNRDETQDIKKPISHELVDAPQNKEEWPAHIKALKLPPAWKDVKINNDPDANLQAIGKDEKGRSQYVYSEKFAKSQAAIKFARIHDMHKHLPEIRQHVAQDQESPDHVVQDHGDCTRLVLEMGVRPGSDDDTGADKKAYGATTLEGRHVVSEGNQTFLRFVGKKGVQLNLPVEDAELAHMLKLRSQKTGDTGKLFPHVNDKSLLAYAHNLPGGGWKTKDMRTLKGTREAHDLLSTMQTPTNKKEYEKALKVVATHVARKLGNTPAVALSSYISPAVFAPWQHAADTDAPEPVNKKPKPKQEQNPKPQQQQ